MNELNEEIERSHEEWCRREKALRNVGGHILSDLTVHHHLLIGFGMAFVALLIVHLFFNLLDYLILGYNRYTLVLK